MICIFSERLIAASAAMLRLVRSWLDCFARGGGLKADCCWWKLIVTLKHFVAFADIWISVRWDELPVLKSDGYHIQDKAAMIAHPWTVHDVVDVCELFLCGVLLTVMAEVCRIFRDG